MLDDGSLSLSCRTISWLRQCHDNETVVEKNHSSIGIQWNQNHGFTRYWDIKKVSDAVIIQSLVGTTLHEKPESDEIIAAKDFHHF